MPRLRGRAGSPSLPHDPPVDQQVQPPVGDRGDPVAGVGEPLVPAAGVRVDARRDRDGTVAPGDGVDPGLQAALGRGLVPRGQPVDVRLAAVSRRTGKPRSAAAARTGSPCRRASRGRRCGCRCRRRSGRRPSASRGCRRGAPEVRLERFPALDDRGVLLVAVLPL